ncbi:MAG: cytochrome-c peroxidase [Paracoccaceae bacterium]|nr:cytochrome-c peroxidase [Paracoccaceae bacterium]
MRLFGLLAAGAAFVFGTTACAGQVPAPVEDAHFGTFDMEEVRLGRDLFYDRILSGNKNTACATCHHPKFATSDGLSLGLGEGGVGLGPERRADPENLPEQRIPRNSPSLFNLGSPEFTVLFHDGRIEVDESRKSGLRTPLEDDMVVGFDSILSAQTMFPVLSPDEMAGHYQENDISKLVRQGRLTDEGGAWDAIAERVSAIAAYDQAFQRVYPEIAAGQDIHFTDISNAIAAFVSFEWRSIDSPFDAYLRGEGELDAAADRGMALFYGDAGCGVCHAGTFQTDHGFHAMRQPQIGPGKAERFESHQRDIGRQRVTGLAEDAYAFRTPSLRNVMKTGPWGHAGAFTEITAFLRQHTDTGDGFAAYQRQPVLPALAGAADDWAVMNDPAEQGAILAAGTEIDLELTAGDISDLVAFLDSLTDPTAIEGRLGVPESVPSGLPVDR